MMDSEIKTNPCNDTFGIEVDVTAFVKWENRARKMGKTVEECVSIFLADQVQRTR